MKQGNLLAALVRLLTRPARETVRKAPPLPENPYRRFYTKNRSFEELARRGRPKK